MMIRRILTRKRLAGLTAIGLTLAVSGVFKGAAFARESFIAARFGLSAVTDAYFALQQLPLTLATYIYGAFSLAFVPAFARAENAGGSKWLSGFVLWALSGGFALTGFMLVSGPLLMRILHLDSTADIRATLVLLSFCFAAILITGIWAAMCTARGHNLWALSMSGFPYLFMTLALIGLYAAGHLNNLSLPLSMSLGFILVGVYSLIRVVASRSFSKPDLRVWRDSGFRHFLRELGASSTENLGYAANQLSIIYFLSQTGTGAISGNSCAMRIATLAYTLLGMPMGQLVQAKLCVAKVDERRMVFQRWLVLVVVMMVAFAAILVGLRYPLIRLVYMHGKFQAAALHTVATLLPPWTAYIVVMSVNAVLARYLFILSRGTAYLRNQMAAYVVANLLRVLVVGRWGSEWIIWCSVLAEGCSMILSLRLCLTGRAGAAASTATKLKTADEIA